MMIPNAYEDSNWIWQGSLARMPTAIVRAALTITIMTLLFICGSGAQRSTGAHLPGWNSLAGVSLSSVAWSPDGKRIAYVAAPDTGDSDVGPLEADIWVTTLTPQGVLDPAKKLLHTTRRGRGMPTALFWLSNHEIGWAASLLHPRVGACFAFYSTRLKDGKTQELMDTRFTAGQARGHGSIAAPDDVFWYPRTRTLLFTGVGENMVTPDSGAAEGITVTYMYDTISKALTAMGTGFDDDYGVTLCYVTDKEGFTTFYYVGSRSSRIGLWANGLHSHYIMNPVAVSGSLRSNWLALFPRLSPNGHLLAYLKSGDENDGLFVLDTRDKTQKALASFPPSWSGVGLAMGCPFSWSPNGKRIAYADGSRIKIVNVPQHIGGKKK